VSSGLRRLLQEALLDLEFGHPLEQVVGDLCADLDRLIRRAERAQARSAAPTVPLRLPPTAILPGEPAWDGLLRGSD
jgi:hypothetical protein